MTSILFLAETIQCKQLDEFIWKPKLSFKFLCEFFKSTSKLENFLKKMTLIAYELPKKQTPKYVVR